VGLVLQAIWFLVIWALHRSFASPADIKKVREEMDEKLAIFGTDMRNIGAAHTATAGKLELLTQRVDTLPNAEDISEIKIGMERMAGDYRALNATVTNVDNHIKSIGNSVRRIESFMMTGKQAEA
jgi:hypothetical protein